MQRNPVREYHKRYGAKFAGGIYGSYLAQTTRGCPGDKSSLCGYPSSIHGRIYPPSDRVYESTDVGVAPGKPVGRGFEESAQGKPACHSRVCRHRTDSRCLIEGKSGWPTSIRNGVPIHRKPRQCPLPAQRRARESRPIDGESEYAELTVRLRHHGRQPHSDPNAAGAKTMRGTLTSG